tara:strand:- start:231 stop:470 length:240 start_codon:yes stop_codon:yes gene_type:complete
LQKIVTSQDANKVLDLFIIRDFLTEVAEGEYSPRHEDGKLNHYGCGYAVSIVDRFDYLAGFDIPHSEKREIHKHCLELI